MGARPTPKRSARAVERIARHRDPRSVLRARRMGLDVLRRRPPALELYYEPGDPLSHLCAQLLPMLSERVRTRIDVRLVGQSAPPEYPEVERQRRYALRDAARIAPARGLRFPADARIPDPAARMRVAGALSEAADVDAFARLEAELAPGLFAGEDAPGDGDEGATKRLLAANARRRKQLGHYLPAVWQFDGDWFWGLDRLDFLERRLRANGLLDGDAPLSQLRPEDADLPGFTGAPPRLDFFYSFRSPYSHLAALEMQHFHESWPSGVRVRPVLPMAMRNMKVSPRKRMYTVRDVKRVADQLGVEFGRVADPLGDGARHALQVFPLADGTQQQLDLLVSAGRAVWSEGIAIAEADGMRHVCERAGIAWAEAGERIGRDIGIEYAERNRADLLAAGLWGVPDYVAGDFTAWGQDRFWMLRELLRRAAANAEAPGEDHLARRG